MIAGVDLGGTRIKMVLASEAGDILADATHPTDDRANPDWPKIIRAQLADWKHEGPIGLAAPGIANPNARSIWWMMGRLDAIQGLDWAEALGRPIRVLNDAQAHLLAETWVGAARGEANAILLTLGTGVGGAAIVDGNLLRGSIGRAGHLGHISLDPDGSPDIVNTPGSLEDAIGEHSLAQRSAGRYSRTEDLIANLHDPLAHEIWHRSVRALAAGIASLVNVLDPRLVVLGGGISQAGDALLVPLRQHLNAMEWRPHGHSVSLVLSSVGPHAGALGAARFAQLNP